MRFTLTNHVHDGQIHTVFRIKDGNQERVVGHVNLRSMAELDELKAHFPGDCVGEYGCQNDALPGMTVRDPETHDDLPACEKHADAA